jgi:hypothetical protein
VAALIAGAGEENPENAELRRIAGRLGVAPPLGAPRRAGAGVPAATGARVMIGLVGEQPLPVLLPILHYRPAHVVLVPSAGTERVARNVEAVLAGTPPATVCVVDAFAIERARGVLLDLILREGWAPGDLVFNLTGGTKPMSLAGYRVAQDCGGCTLIYMQTQQGRNECFEYTLTGTSFVLTAERREITPVLTIDQHLQAYGLGAWTAAPPDPAAPAARFTALIAAALTGYVDELMCHVQTAPGAALTIDLIVRCRNQLGLIAVAPAATDQGREGIQRLNTLGAREYLGTFVQRLLALDRERALDADAQAAARHIRLLVLPSFATNGGVALSEDDQFRLRTQVLQALGRW